MTADGPATVALWVHRLLDLGGGTGLGRYVAEVAPALAALDSPLRYELRAVGGPRPDWDASGVPVVPIPRRPRPLHLRWSLGVGPTLESLTGPAAVVHSLYPSFPVRTRAKLAVSVHDLFPLEHPEWFGRRHVVTARRALRQVADRADVVIASSAYTAGRLRERLGVEPERLRVVHLGIAEGFRVDEAAFAPAPARAEASGPPHVLAIGRVGPRKNLAVAVEALAHVSGIDLVCVGPIEDEEGAHLVALAERLGVSSRLQLRGPVPDDELRSLLRSSLALVHPSRSEGFGFTPLEAMASGVPALVAATGSLPEVCGDGALLLSPDDVEAWAAAIASVRDDPELVTGLVARGRAQARTFSWAATAAATHEVHCELVAAGA